MNAVIRIFSGQHRGAEIELSAGTYVIGTDDSCDLILSDTMLSARHAAFLIADSGTEVSVTIEPLDGSVIFEGHTLDDSATLPARTPVQLGTLIAAWAMPSDIPTAWNELEASLSSAGTRPSASASVTAPFATAAEEEAPAAALDEDQAALKEIEADSLESGAQDAVPNRTPRPRTVRTLTAAAALVLAASLCFTWQGQESQQKPADVMRALLDEAGYQKLSVSDTESSVTVRGQIASDRERGRLMRLAQHMDFPVYLDVTVGSDTADALKASFNTMGLYPEVTELPLSSHPGLKLKAYIRDGIIEERALRTAARNIPALRPKADGTSAMEIFRDIRHESDVHIVLDPALAAAGLASVQAEYLDGRIMLTAPFTPQMRHELDRVLQEVKDALGVPICFDIVTKAQVEEEKALRSSVYQKETPALAEKAQLEPSRRSAESFKVTSVFMGAMRFITLDTGERVFEGGELPGGFILEHIDVDALTLSKNSIETLYPLRGPNE